MKYCVQTNILLTYFVYHKNKSLGFETVLANSTLMVFNSCDLAVSDAFIKEMYFIINFITTSTYPLFSWNIQVYISFSVIKFYALIVNLHKASVC